MVSPEPRSHSRICARHVESRESGEAVQTHLRIKLSSPEQPGIYPGTIRPMMVDLSFWGDLALSAWVNLNPSPQWANHMIESRRGLPFGTYLHSTRPARRRTLTGPLHMTGDSLWHKMQVYSSLEPEQRTDEQATCGFLTKLPIDIRLMIYEMVLGGMVLHLSATSQKSRIVHSACPTPNKINKLGQHICPEIAVRPSSPSPRDVHPSATGLLPLLVTCRRIYSEAIATLYSANTFEFTQNHAAFSFLKIMIPPQRLPSIRHFRLHLRIPRHPALNPRARRDWGDLWDFFADDLCGLQSLHLRLQMLQPAEADIEATRDDAAEAWIRPMLLMALKANARRACRVEIVTRGVLHVPVDIFQDLARGRPASSSAEEEQEGETMRAACAELHARIRLSLGKPG